jgi:apolipoprotein D and lipocalin family protein
MPSARVMVLFAAPVLALLSACSGAQKADMKTVEKVDLPRFMGSWYVIANIPTAIEKGAHNAVERYALDADGSIRTTFTFRDGAFDGKLKTYNPRGFVLDRDTNALWGMRFIWPIKADYRIVYLNDGYSQTVIGRRKRDYVWIMARTPQVPEADYQRMLAVVAGLGYDTGRVQRVPQRWPAGSAP